VLEHVAIPILQNAVFASSEEVMCVANELDGCHGILVRKERLVAVSKVKTPDLDILVS
jgi:hypothetical protein